MPVEWNRQFRSRTWSRVRGRRRSAKRVGQGLDVGVLQSTEPLRSDTRLIPPLISGVVSTIGGLPSVTAGFCAAGRKRGLRAVDRYESLEYKLELLETSCGEQKGQNLELKYKNTKSSFIEFWAPIFCG